MSEIPPLTESERWSYSASSLSGLRMLSLKKEPLHPNDQWIQIQKQSQIHLGLDYHSDPLQSMSCQELQRAEMQLKS